MNRTDFLDNINGLLIINMIFFVHLASFCEVNHSLPIIYLRMSMGFFMSWFFFKAGMFYRRKPLREVVRSSCRRLIVPYLFFNGMGILCAWFLCLLDGQMTIGHLLLPVAQMFLDEATGANLALWFLLSLFVVRCLFSALDHLGAAPLAVACVSIGIAFALNYFTQVNPRPPMVLSFMGYHLFLQLPSYVGNIFVGLSMYALGCGLREKQYDRLLFGLLLVVYLVQFFFPASISMKENEVTGPYFLAILYSVAGIVVFNNVFKMTLDRPLAILTYVGRNSMIYYVTHYVFFVFMFGCFGNWFNRLNPWCVFVLMSVLCVLFFFVMDFIFMRTRMKRFVG